MLIRVLCISNDSFIPWNSFSICFSNTSPCHSSGSFSGSYVSSFLIKKNISFLLCSVRASRGLGFPLLPFIFFFKSSAILFQYKDFCFSGVLPTYISHTLPKHACMPVTSSAASWEQQRSTQRIHPCCVSILPDLCLPKCLDFFDHENKCQAGI